MNPTITTKKWVKVAVELSLLILFLSTAFSLHSQRPPEIIVETGGHTRKVTALLKHPDNRRMISCSWDGSIRIWDTQEGKLIKTYYKGRYNRKYGEIHTAALSPSGTILAIAGKNLFGNGVHLVELETGRTVKTLPSPWQNEVTSLAFSENDKFLALGSKKGKVNLYSPKNKDLSLSSQLLSDPDATLLRTGYTVDNSSVRQLLFVKDDSILIAGSGRLMTALWTPKVKKGSELRKRKWARYAPSSFSGLECLGDSLLFYSTAGGHLQTSLLRNPERMERTVGIVHRNIHSLSFSPDNSLYFIGGNLPCHSEIVNTLDGTHQSYLEIGPHTRPIYSSVFLSNNLLATGDYEGNIYLWNPKNGKLIHDLSALSKRIRSIGETPSHQIAIGHSLNTHVIDLCGQQMRKSPFGIHSLDWSFDPVRMEVIAYSDSYDGTTLRQYCSFKNGNFLEVKSLPGLTKIGMLGFSKNTYRFGAFGIAPMEESYDPFWNPPSILNSESILIPEENRLSLLKWKKTADKPRRRTFGHPATVAMQAPRTKWVISGAPDGTARIYKSASSRQLLCSFLILDAQNWICWTPDHLFAGNENTEAYLGYLVPDRSAKSWNFIPLSESEPRNYSAKTIQADLLQQSKAFPK